MMAAPSPRQESPTDAAPPRDDRVRLAATLVRYADRSDRRTIYPPDTSNVARMSTWLTADADAFRDLDAMR